MFAWLEEFAVITSKSCSRVIFGAATVNKMVIAKRMTNVINFLNQRDQPEATKVGPPPTREKREDSILASAKIFPMTAALQTTRRRTRRGGVCDCCCCCVWCSCPCLLRDCLQVSKKSTVSKKILLLLCDKMFPEEES